MKKAHFFVLAILLIGIAGSFYIFNSGNITGNAAGDAALDSEQLTVYKSQTCGCCVSYVGYLKSESYSVKTINLQDMNSIKSQLNIPLDMQSCHTTVAGDYFIEGHIPMEVVKKLLEEKPDIDGIAMPGMPSGSPGMPGPKKGDFVIYALKDGKSTEYMRL